jgi:hypothetical protein
MANSNSNNTTHSMLKAANHPIIMLRDSSCNVQTPDGKYVFVAKLGFESINKDPALVQELLHKFTHLNDKQLLEANDGVYTWMIYTESEAPTPQPSPELKFICTEVLSPFEIGTRHQALAFNNRTSVGRIYGAGELTKVGPKITFNLRSGTYTYRMVQYNFSRNRAKSKPIIAAFHHFFPEAEEDPDPNHSMIDNVTTVSHIVLDLYKRYGYIVILFDTKNDCVKFNNAFNNQDWQMRYYKKKLDTEKDLDAMHKKIYTESLIKAMESMLEMVTPYVKANAKPNANAKGSSGGRKTRRRQSNSRN